MQGMKAVHRLFLRPQNWLKEPGNSLFCLLWFIYFAANLGRLSYAAVMIEIISQEGFPSAAMGLVGTGFFICYGAGQIGAGYIGDRLLPHRVVLTGLLCTGLVNLVMGFSRTSAQMLALWCINGAAQSILWPSILRVIVDRYPRPVRERVCVHIATTYPAATLFSFVSCAGIVLVFSWRAVFGMVSLILFTATALWGFLFGSLERRMGDSAPRAEGDGRAASPAVSPEPLRRKGLPFFALALICAALVSQGALRDGLMTWIPAYMTQVFSLRTSTAILSSGVLPLINLLGIYISQLLFRRIKNEAGASCCLFGVSILAALTLQFFGALHLALSLGAFAVITACMMGINLMLVSFVPAHFSRMRLVAFMSGFTNSMVYLGSSISTFSIGLVVDTLGWNTLPVILVFLALGSALLCFLAIPRWSAFIRIHP